MNQSGNPLNKRKRNLRLLFEEKRAIEDVLKVFKEFVLDKKVPSHAILQKEPERGLPKCHE